MTRTQKLGLCTWLPEDPVCLAEVNDNFTRLDQSGGRALRLTEAALINLGGLMAAQAHSGGHAAYAQNVSVDAFQDMSNLASYSQLYFQDQRLELLAGGQSSGSVSGGTNVTSGGGDFSASGVTRQISSKQSWCSLFTFQPDAYGQLTKLTLKTTSTATTSTSASVKLSVWDAGTDKMLAETALGTITRGSGEDNSVSFTLDLLLDPNRKYVMMVWIESMPNAYFVLNTLSFTVTPIVYSSGSAAMRELPIPDGATRAELLLHGTADAPQPALSFDGAQALSFSGGAASDDVLPGGAAATLWRYTLELPADTQRAQLKLTIPGSGCKIYDYALIFL